MAHLPFDGSLGPAFRQPFGPALLTSHAGQTGGCYHTPAFTYWLRRFVFRGEVCLTLSFALAVSQCCSWEYLSSKLRG